MAKYYVDEANKYLGGWEMPLDVNGEELDHPDVPQGAIEVPNAPNDSRQLWDGVKFLPVDSNILELEKELESTQLLNRAVDLTFLDGHWITLRALFGAGTVTGVPTLDSAIAADDRTAFDIFFRDKVKARL